MIVVRNSDIIAEPRCIFSTSQIKLQQRRIVDLGYWGITKLGSQKTFCFTPSSHGPFKCGIEVTLPTWKTDLLALTCPIIPEAVSPSKLLPLKSSNNRHQSIDLSKPSVLRINYCIQARQGEIIRIERQ